MGGQSAETDQAMAIRAAAARLREKRILSLKTVEKASDEACAAHEHFNIIGWHQTTVIKYCDRNLQGIIFLRPPAPLWCP